MSVYLPARCINYKLIWDYGRGKLNKIPCDPNGIPISVKASSHWRTFEEANAFARWDRDRPDLPYGVGFVLNGDGWFLLDIDNARRDDGRWDPDAVQLFRYFKGALGEISVSGKGLHVIGKCDPARTACLKNRWGGNREFYTDKRFVALSKEGLRTIGEYDDGLD